MTLVTLVTPDPRDPERVPHPDGTGAPRKLLEMRKFRSTPGFLNRNLQLRDPRVPRLHSTAWGAPAGLQHASPPGGQTRDAWTRGQRGAGEEVGDGQARGAEAWALPGGEKALAGGQARGGVILRL